MTRDRAAERARGTFSAVVLGTDAVLAAAPATHVQLTHACLAAGYHFAAPASWGDELIAMESLRIVSRREDRPVVHCSCPIVAERLLGVGDDLSPFIVSVVAPPVAVARYLRALGEGRTVHVTYVGRCPAATDDSIDARLTPEEFLEILARRGAAPLDQPEVFDSVIPPDRRRFRSLPGGLPTADMVWREGGQRRLVELEGDECLTDLAQHLVAGERELIDLAPALGCACAGAGASSAPRLAVHARGARAEVAASEPPRAPSDVVDHDLHIDLLRRPRPAVRQREVPVVVGGEVAREPSPVGKGAESEEPAAPSPGSSAQERARAREAGHRLTSAPVHSASAANASRAASQPPRSVARDASPDFREAARSGPESRSSSAQERDSGTSNGAAAAGAPSEERSTADVPDVRDEAETESLLRRRATPSGAARTTPTAFPVAQDAAGRALPRAYAGFRRPGAPAASPSVEDRPPTARAGEPWPRETPAMKASPAEGDTHEAPPEADPADASAPDEMPAPHTPAAAKPVGRSTPPAAAAPQTVATVAAGRDDAPVAEFSARFAERLARVERRARRSPMLILLVLAFLLLATGAAIGLAAARTFVQPVAVDPVEGGGAAAQQSIDAPAEAGTVQPPARETTGAALEAPAARPSSAARPPAGTRQAITRATASGQVAPERAAARVAQPIQGSPPEVVAPVARQPETIRPDTVVPRDTSRPADTRGAAGADLAPEREAIRRELEIRRARIDSIARRVDSLRLATPPR